MDFLPKFTLCYLLFLISFGEFVYGDQECYHGIESPGYTVPKGDIFIRYGDPVDIYCILNARGMRAAGPDGSKKLSYLEHATKLSREMIQVVNETTIKFHVEKPKLGKVIYTCKIGKTTSVCSNFVWVGVPPQEIKDFRCISQNLDNLTCRWTAPENFVKTTYHLSYSADPNSDHYKCPKIEGEDNEEERWCTWNLTTAPIYRQSLPQLIFSLTATNTFGTYTMPQVLINHFEHVRPNKPESIRVTSTTSNSVGLSWFIPSTLQIFSSGLHCRIMYQSSYGTKEWKHSPIIETKGKAEVKYVLGNLEFAHAYYDIRVSLRSAVADPNDESMWSDHAIMVALTASKRPDEPPKTNIGSFEIVTYENNSDRNVRLYWSHVPDEKRNGENFTYVVTLLGDEEVENTTQNAYILYERLSPHRSYTFIIRSRNEMGFSDNYSVIKIPTYEDCAKEPIRLRKEVLDSGYYRLSWEPPKQQDTKNYTIFWCNDDKERAPCSGKLNWVVVPSNNTSHDQRIPSNKTFQFAIAANTDHGSSGMTWAHCTDYKDSIGKIDEILWHNFSARRIAIQWHNECPHKSITGYIVYYCPVSLHLPCTEAEKHIEVPSNKLSVEIQGLEPYTTYSLQIAAVINSTKYSQRSKAKEITTLEGVPTPPQQLRILNVTNSTISLRWNAPEKTYGWLKFYKISYNDEFKKIDQDIVFNNTIPVKTVDATLINLTSYKNYTISVQACINNCSDMSNQIRVQTEIGHPGKIWKPFITQNATYTSISWESPQKRNGRIEYYELKIKEKLDDENKTTIMNITGQEWGFNSCGKEKVLSFFVSVRAVNLDGDKVYYGNWSDEVQSYCRSPGNYTIYLLVPFIILFFSGMTYLFRRLYGRYRIMKEVHIVMPVGLQRDVIEVRNLKDDNESLHVAEDEKHLLMKKNDVSPNTNVGDSSGCSSAHESVTCSMDSASNISSNTSDSGTEQPKTPSAEDLADLTTTSLRQRNIRPLSTGKPYVVFPIDASKTAPKSYCVLGIDPSANPEGSSTYIPLPSVMDKPTFSPSESHSPPYVLTGELLKSANPSYIPFKTPLATDKNPAYVIAGSADLMSTDVLNLDAKQTVSSPDNAYIKIADNMTLKNPNDIKTWQPSSLSTNPKTGYVAIGEIPPMKKESKGYVPHRQFESKALKED